MQCIIRLGAFVILLFVAELQCGAEEPKGDTLNWRRPELDGVTCLYLQLRLLGYTGTRAQVASLVRGEGIRASLAELARAASELGFDLVPVKLTVAELSSQQSPTIILFEAGDRGHGLFHLCVGCSETAPTVLLIHGAFITHTVMSMDEFRRGWTGLALVSRSSSPWPKRWFGAGVGASATGFVLVLARQISRWRRPPEEKFRQEGSGPREKI